MISVLLTAYKEPNTIGRAIESFQRQLSKNDEILVAAPDEETKKVIQSYFKKDKRVEWKKNNCEKVKESNRKNYVKRDP